MQVANTTAAIVGKAPPYVSYHVRGVVRAAGESTIDRTVSVRTDDGIAIVRDDDTGKDELRPAFPAPPTFDALAAFKLSGVITLRVAGGKHREGDMRILNVRPLHYEAAPSHADAVARSIAGYVVTFAPDATPQLGHLQLERNALMHDERWMRDVWYDPATLVPTRIVWGGINDFTLDARYTMADGHWVLHAISAAATYHAALWLGRMSVAIEGKYGAYAFSDTPPDPRLAPGVSAAVPPA